MPCRDDYEYLHPKTNPDIRYEYEESLKKLQQRNDELAEENCRLRAFACAIYETSDIQLLGDRLTDSQLQTLHKARKDQKAHRVKDKNRAIKAQNAKIQKLHSKVKTINELGGEPTKKLLNEIEKAEKELDAIKKSDSLTTDLY